jgi:hypothetical protein
MSSLSISKTNVLIGVTPTVTDAGVGEVAANISDPDHSLNYTCGTAVGNFEVDYGAQTNISYVAVSGHTAATPANATIQIYNGALLIDSVVLVRNNNVMFTFPQMTFTALKIRFVTVPNNFQMTVSFIAAGQHLTIATGEQSGYSRNWLNRHISQRTTTNLQVGPVSSLTQKKVLKGTLSLPNESIAFAEVDWQTFIDFAFKQPFFIKEVATKPESSYICFDPKFDANAHSQTRALNALKLKFTVFNGL